MPYKLKDLSTKTTAQIALDIANIPAKETELDLSGNKLGSLEKLDEAFKGFPRSVTSVNLRNNSFGWRPHKLALICEALSPDTTFVDLGEGGLGCNTGRDNDDDKALFADVARVFKALANVKTLRLEENDLHMLLPAESISKYLKNSLSGVETIYLSYQEIAWMSAEQRHALKEIFPAIKKVILTDYSYKELDYSTSPSAAYYARFLGDKSPPLSLLTQCAFFCGEA